jgi:hypothetical protein
MNGKSKALVALAVVALLGVFTSVAAAGEKVEKAKTKSSFELKGSNGYWIEVTAEREAGEKRGTVTVTARRERYKSEWKGVSYTVLAPVSWRDGFDAKLPGLGRIDVSFVQKRVRKTKENGGAVCTNSTEAFREGTFRGTISFRAEGGFTQVHSSGTTGSVRESRRRVCKEIEGGWFLEGQPGEPKRALLTVEGPATPGSPEVFFSTAGGPETEPPTTSGGIPEVTFSATWYAEKRGIGILAFETLNTVSNYYRVPGPVGTLADASVAPPAPFSGTGTYHVESPTSAAWTGDLSVTFPGPTGTVPLTGPGFTARLCEGDGNCTGAPEPGA